MRFWLFIIIVIVVAGLVQAPDGLEPATRKALDRAKNHFKERKTDLAEKDLATAISSNRKKTDCYLRSLDLCLDSSETAGWRAKECTERIARELLTKNDHHQLDRKLASDELLLVLINYSRVCRDIGRHKDACNAIYRASELVKDNAVAADLVGYQCLELDYRLDLATRLVTKAVRSNPNNPLYIDSLGWAYCKLGRHNDADRELRRAVSLNPGSGVIRYHLGAAYFASNKLSEAQIELNKAIVCGDSIPESRALLLQIRAANGRNTGKL